MATVKRILARANADAVEFSIDYDDVTRLISLVRIINNGARGSFTLTLTDRVTAAVLWGPRTQAFGTGTFTQNVSGLGLLMDNTPVRGHAALTPPFNIITEWAS